MKQPIWIQVLALATLVCAACSPADWAAAQSAGRVVGAAVDTFALVRAEQIRAKTATAADAAAKGDTFTALRALAEAQAAVTAKTLEELAETRAQLGVIKAQCVSCSLTPSCVLDAPGQPPAPAGTPCGAGGVCDGAGLCCAGPP